MMRAWIGMALLAVWRLLGWTGVALLAVSWLLGMTYYCPANRLAWVVLVVAGAVLLGGSIKRGPRRREAWIALVLLLPAVWFAPWPLRAAPLMIVAGLAVELLPIPRRWPRWVGRGAVAAGVVMLVQSLCMAAYAACTARSHELPWPLPELLAGVARLLGVEATADGSPGVDSAVVMHSIRQVHRLGATWDLLLDPATLCFFVGSLVMLGLVAWNNLPDGRRLWAWLAAVRNLALVVVVWLPVRAGLLMALYLHRVLRFDDDQPLHVMNHFFSPWVLLLMLLGPVLLAWQFVRLPRVDSGEWRVESGETSADTHHSPLSTLHYPSAAGLLLLAGAIFAAAVYWDPVGRPKRGRVMFVERHSTWEPIAKPYDTTWFGHDSGYNYAAVYDYLSQYFEMSRLLESDTIDRAALDDCDVLVIKIPTARYSKEEIDAVVRFVERGGGLLLVGDHTNVFKSGTYLNDIARHFGFTFRHDLLFGSGESPYEQLYVKPRVPHPIVQHLPPTDFAGPCSIDPGYCWGRAVIRETGLWSLPPDYHVDNYFPVPQHRPEMRYGAFIQLWSTRHGRGRVLAFSDSTIFSNFCTFQPGKAELLRGMVDWLNHGNRAGDPRGWLLAVGLLTLALGLWLARARHRAASEPNGGVWLVLLAAAACGWVAASFAVAEIGQRAMPLPEPKPNRSLPRVVIDRTVSKVPLCKGPRIQGDGQGYGLFETWIPRLGCYTTRSSNSAAFSGDALVVLCPSRSVSPDFRAAAIRYVAEGGKLLVVDSPGNAKSRANDLLWPFGLSVHHDQRVRGVLTIEDDWPGIEVEGAESACRVTGGRPIAHLDTTPVGAVARYEKGTVMAVGFGTIFSDAGMGYGYLDTPHLWVIQPDANMLFPTNTYVRYNVQFALLRALIGDQPVTKYFSGHVVIDRTLSEVSLPEPGTTPEEDEGFGLSEMWIPHLGYSTERASGPDALSGDALVIFYPSRGVTDEFRDRLVEYVAAGGKLLLVDSPENKCSTANDLLTPFRLSVDQEAVDRGRLIVADDEGNTWAEITV
ncbi:MAG: hypothetical protein ACYSWU_14335, partial [Planctomycetota bacterium]